MDCDNLTEVYYGGTEAQWKQISIASGNDNLLAANIHYGSSPEQPSEPEKPEKPETPQPGGEDEIVGEIPANGFGVMVTTAMVNRCLGLRWSWLINLVCRRK